MPSTRTATLLLLATTSLAALPAQAAPLTVPELKRHVADLMAGDFPARDCTLTGGQPDDGTLHIGSDGHVAGPSIDVSLFDPTATLMLGRSFEGTPRAEVVDVSLQVGDQYFHIMETVGSHAAGRLEAGKGSATEGIQDGSICNRLDAGGARLEASSFNFARDLAALFATSHPVTGHCFSGKRGPRGSHAAMRDVSLTIDDQGITVDGTRLPFASPDMPLESTQLASVLANGTMDLNIGWRGKTFFNAERFIGSDAFTTFGYSLAGRPDAQEMICRVVPH